LVRLSSVKLPHVIAERSSCHPQPLSYIPPVRRVAALNLERSHDKISAKGFAG
jgi:hypothetical protein